MFLKKCKLRPSHLQKKKKKKSGAIEKADGGINVASQAIVSCPLHYAIWPLYLPYWASQRRWCM